MQDFKNKASKEDLTSKFSEVLSVQKKARLEQSKINKKGYEYLTTRYIRSVSYEKYYSFFRYFYKLKDI